MIANVGKCIILCTSFYLCKFENIQYIYIYIHLTHIYIYVCEVHKKKTAILNVHRDVEKTDK